MSFHFNNLYDFLDTYKKDSEDFLKNFEKPILISKIKQLDLRKNNQYPLISLDDVQILESLNYKFQAELNYSLEAYIYLIKNSEKLELTIYFFLSYLTLEKFKLLLTAKFSFIDYDTKTSKILTIHSKILPCYDILGTKIYHSLYYFITEPEIIAYLSQNGLDVYENFADLCHYLYFEDKFGETAEEINSLKKFSLIYQDLDISLITKEMFVNYLNFVEMTFENYAERDYLDFIEKYFNYYHSLPINYLYLYYDIYSETNSIFFYNYFKLSMTEAILEEYIDLIFDNKNIQFHLCESNIFQIWQLYGFEKLKMTLPEDLINQYGNNLKIYYWIIKTLKELKYPEMKKLKEKFRVEYERKLEEREELKNVNVREYLLKCDVINDSYDIIIDYFRIYILLEDV